MANSFITLPQPAGNGTGASVDTSALGATKTITITSSGGVYEPLTNVELSNDGGVSWSVIASFNGAGAVTLDIAAGKMRMSVSRFIDGTIPSVEIGAESSTVTLNTLAVPAGNGVGAAMNVSATSSFKTFQVVGAFGGVVNIEISEDGGATWGTALTFIQGGLQLQSTIITADLMRVRRVGVPVVAAGLPVVAVASTTSSGGGGGGGNTQAFVYTATGLEGATFNVPLPAARASTNYIAQAVDMGRADGALAFYTCPQSGYALNQIQVQGIQSTGAGDKIGIIVQDVTS